MTYRVLRFPLEITDYQTVTDFGRTTKPISVAVSRTDPNSSIDMWIPVADGRDEFQVGIYIVGTGHPMPEGAQNFIGTVVTPSGLVWHVWEGYLS